MIAKILIIISALCGISIPVVYGLFIYGKEKEREKSEKKKKKEYDWWVDILSESFIREDIISDESIEYFHKLNNHIDVMIRLINETVHYEPTVLECKDKMINEI